MTAARDCRRNIQIVAIFSRDETSGIKFLTVVNPRKIGSHQSVSSQLALLYALGFSRDCHQHLRAGFISHLNIVRSVPPHRDITLPITPHQVALDQVRRTWPILLSIKDVQAVVRSLDCTLTSVLNRSQLRSLQRGHDQTGLAFPHCDTSIAYLRSLKNNLGLACFCSYSPA